jgi:hypothetical protein
VCKLITDRSVTLRFPKPELVRELHEEAKQLDAEGRAEA